MKTTHTLLAIALFVLPLASQSKKSSVDLITSDNLRADLSFLAAPSLQGRNATSAEDHIATDYIASEFMRLGLKPAGDNGSYLQSFEIVTGEVDRDAIAMTSKIAGAEHNYAFNRDFRWIRQSLNPKETCGAIAFAGYAIAAPEFDYNDFASMDVKGKVVIALNREPRANDANSKFMGTWDTYHAFNWHKLEGVRKLGAAAFLLVQDRVARDVKTTVASSPRPGGGTWYALAGEMWDIPTFTITREVADQLLAPSGKKVDDLQAQIDSSLKPASFDVPTSSVCVKKSFKNLKVGQGRNVVGILEGSDTNLKSEAVLLTAHHDHMGASDGHVYYGADDDASGVAALIEIARAIRLGNIHPRRSIVFVAYDAEERIFLGSYFYTHHPAVPLDRTVANLNLDMIGRDEADANWPVPDDKNVNMVNVLGTRYNPGLRRVIEQQNRAIGLKLDYKMDVVDPDSLWSRSDHFWFATLHIPQVEFQTGLHPDYHTENDTWQRINYPKLTKIVRLVFLSALDVSNSPRRLAFDAAGAPAKP